MNNFMDVMLGLIIMMDLGSSLTSERMLNFEEKKINNTKHKDL